MSDTALKWDGLMNGEERNMLYPETFFMWPRPDREGLPIGKHVKLGFLNPEGGGDRMWVEITEHVEDRYIGKLLNMPLNVDGIGPDSPVAFGPEHILDIWDETEAEDD